MLDLVNSQFNRTRGTEMSKRLTGIVFVSFLSLIAVIVSSTCVANIKNPSTHTEARAVIKAAMDQWRGTTSQTQIKMTIHRPDWQRVMTMTAWTEGDKNSLVRVATPKKDAGSATLLKDNQMWTFSPKVNRVIRIPSSMMNQSWMGGDFSNKDISKSTDVLDSYTHTLDRIDQDNGHQVYVITSVPNSDAAVVWGKEVFKIRNDHVLLEQQFWDQDGRLIKSLTALKIAALGGRTLATQLRMIKHDKPEEWTEMTTLSAEFDITLSSQVFTLSNLRNPRR
jgi:outer membrane lipoprotein-sorting protein